MHTMMPENVRQTSVEELARGYAVTLAMAAVKPAAKTMAVFVENLQAVVDNLAAVDLGRCVEQPQPNCSMKHLVTAHVLAVA